MTLERFKTPGKRTIPFPFGKKIEASAEGLPKIALLFDLLLTENTTTS